MAVSRISVLVLFVVLVIGVTAAGAQVRLTGADLAGTITDPSGAVLPGVTITATSLDTGVPRTAVSDATGRYVVQALPPGTYGVTAELAGFVNGVRESVALALGALVDVDFQLSLAPVQQSVTVTGSPPVANPFRTSVAFVVEPRQISDLPINGRRFVSFAALSPGVVPAGSTEAGAETSGLSFAGGRPVSNNLLVDGLDNNDRIQGGANTSFSQESVREFQVITASYPAELGGATGGILNIVTRSGGNVAHGGGFAYFRDDALNARNYFERYDPFGNAVDREKAPFDQWQFGGTLGGPLRRNRTFAFASAERVHIDNSNFVTIDPTVAAVMTASGYPIEVGDVPYAFRLTEIMGKVDHQWTPNRLLTVRAHGSDVTNENHGAFGGLVAPSHAAAQYRTDWGLSASESDVIGARWVNEARVQFSVQDQQTRALDPTCGGPCTDPTLGKPAVTLLGAATAGQSEFEPTDRSNTGLQIKNTLTYAGQRHSFKAGVDYTFIDQEALLSYSFGGSYTFAELPPIPGLSPVPLSALQAFVFGLPVYYVQGYGDGTSPFTYQEFAAFAQDDWRAGSRLTLKAGVRYQHQVFPDYDVVVSSLLGTTLNYPFPLGGGQVSPRVAAAYDPAGDGRTSIHAAYGFFFGNQLTTMYGATDVFTRPDGTRLHLFPFPSSIAGWQSPDHRLPDIAVGLPRVTITIGPEARTPRVHQSSAGVTRALSDRLSLSADVVYSRGSHQLGSLEYNPLVPSLGPGRRPNDVNGIAGTSTNASEFNDFGESWYRALFLSLRQRFAAGSAFSVAYTWADARDNSSSFAGTVNDNGRGRNPADLTGLPVGFDPLSEKGPAATDQRHRVVAEGIYVGPGRVQFAGLITANSGVPFSPIAGADLNGDGSTADRARTNPADSATVVGRNSQRLPAQATVDIRVSRSFAASPRVSVLPVFEVFNLFNRTNFSEINNVFGTGAFPSQPARDAQGRVTYGTFQKALAPRQVQLALRVTF